jgi:hypothetical protein
MPDLRQQMVSATPTPAPTTTKRKGSRIMWWIAGGLATFAAVVWAGFFIAAGMGAMDKPTAIVVATVGALALEGTVWCTAAAIGVSVFEARKRIWRFITFRGNTR